jgi:hypothetical protein
MGVIIAPPIRGSIVRSAGRNRHAMESITFVNSRRLYDQGVIGRVCS